MNNISFRLSVYSPSLDLLEDLRPIPSLNTEILREGEMFKTDIISVNTSDSNSDDTIELIVNAVRKLVLQFPKLLKKETRFIIDIEIVVSNADEVSIPSIVFTRDYISLASELEFQTRFHLRINSSTKRGLINSGAYLYIDSDNEIDVPVLNKIAGIQPSVVYRKGHMGRYTIACYNAWGLEVSSDNQLPDVTTMMLMYKLHNAKEVGYYCKEKHLDSHVDITCYSIPSAPVDFQIEPAFFTFLKELNVLFMDMDFMN